MREIKCMFFFLPKLIFCVPHKNNQQTINSMKFNKTINQIIDPIITTVYKLLGEEALIELRLINRSFAAKIDETGILKLPRLLKNFEKFSGLSSIVKFTFQKTAGPHGVANTYYAAHRQGKEVNYSFYIYDQKMKEASTCVEVYNSTINAGSNIISTAFYAHVIIILMVKNSLVATGVFRGPNKLNMKVTTDIYSDKYLEVKILLNCSEPITAVTNISTARKFLPINDNYLLLLCNGGYPLLVETKRINFRR